MRLAARIQFLWLQLSILKHAFGVPDQAPVLNAQYEGATSLRRSRVETLFDPPIDREPISTVDPAELKPVLKRDNNSSLHSSSTKSGAKTCSIYTSTSIINSDTTELVTKTACAACSTITKTSQLMRGETIAFVVRTCDKPGGSAAQLTTSGKTATKNQISMSPASTAPSYATSVSVTNISTKVTSEPSRATNSPTTPDKSVIASSIAAAIDPSSSPLTKGNWLTKQCSLDFTGNTDLDNPTVWAEADAAGTWDWIVQLTKTEYDGRINWSSFVAQKLNLSSWQEYQCQHLSNNNDCLYQQDCTPTIRPGAWMVMNSIANLWGVRDSFQAIEAYQLILHNVVPLGHIQSGLDSSCVNRHRLGRKQLQSTVRRSSIPPARDLLDRCHTRGHDGDWCSLRFR